MKFLVIALAMLLAGVMPSRRAHAQIRLPNVLSDHAVLQRDRAVRIWGWAQPGEKVKVMIHHQHASCKTDASGHWQVHLKPERAGGPYDLQVSGSSSIVLHDIDFGDVYLASGQSNMGYSFAGLEGSVMPHAHEVLAAATYPNLRLLKIQKAFGTKPQQDQLEKWAESSPESAATFSLLGYLFGRSISEREHVPVGIIEAAFGGTPVEAWVSPEALASVPDLQSALTVWKNQIDYRIKIGKPRPPGVGGFGGGPDQRHQGSWEASAIFDTMILPVTRYTIKGVIWYQGESSTDPTRASRYAEVFPLLINDWRKQWEEPNLPFVFVQISSYMGPEWMSWGTVRDAQRRTLSVPNTAMAVTYDIGSEHNQHPIFKKETAERIILAARALFYGEKVEFTGPLFQNAVRQGNSMRVFFTHADHLHVGAGELKGFELAGPDGSFVSATATINDNSVLVSSPSVADPKYVRYAWANYADGNLYNSAALPAPTFTCEPLSGK